MGQSTRYIETVLDILPDKAWQTLEGALLGVSSRISDVLEVMVILSPAIHRRQTLDRTTFLPRFKEVGRVEFRPRPMVDAPRRSGRNPLED